MYDGRVNQRDAVPVEAHADHGRTMRVFGTCGSLDRDTRREAAWWSHFADARAHRLAAGALLFLAACAPSGAGAHTAGAAAAADLMECVAHARMHPGTTPHHTHLVTYDQRSGGADDASLEYAPPLAQPDPEWPATGCETESDARPRMNPARSAQPAGGFLLQINWRQRIVPDHGMPDHAARMPYTTCTVARRGAPAPAVQAAATPLARFERAPRGPPATPVASHG